MPHSHPPKFIPEFKIPEKSLGRSLVVHSQANLAYPMRPLLMTAPKKRISRSWLRRVGAFDQGSDSDCVLESSSGACLTAPNISLLKPAQRQILKTHDGRMKLYVIAKGLDAYEGVDYDGTSTDAGFKALRNEGYIKEWRWCLGDETTGHTAMDDVLDTLEQHGSVVLGINWYDSYDEAVNGLIVKSPNASIRGGHAIEATRVDFSKKRVGGWQSWGPGWGDNGHWWMSFDTLEMALHEEGEAVTAII